MTTSSVGSELVLVHVEHHVATITLNRPEQGNAFTAALAGQLQRALRACDRDGDVRCIVLTGAGRHFCTGLDLSEGAAAFGADGNLAEFANDDELRPPAELRTPVIAAINGHAVGIGLTLAMQCDIRVAAEGAKLGFVFVRRGIVPEFYSHWTVPRIAGFGRAAELFLTGRTITAAEAEPWGLVNYSLPADEVLTRARAIATEIATEASPAAVAATKEILWQSANADLEAVHDAEARAVHWLRTQPDVAEGVTSFLERRAPRWSTTTSDRAPVADGGDDG